MGLQLDQFVWVAAVMTGYLAGSIPFGLVLTRAAGIDLRAIGSGNIGATNVLRTGRKDLALATLLLDSFKAGLVALLFTILVTPQVGFVAGAAAFLGHCYPVWLNFKGGKGVATYAGLLAFVSWRGLIFAAPIWLGLFALTRISSLSALIAAVIAPIGALLLGEDPFTVGGLALLSAFVFWTHRSNIARLLKGEEPRFGAPKPGDTPADGAA
ncbi:MAG: glycerol-3-phosphate 1-O-acyltransferase PlsY [Hyphomonadaceae bacterium]|nr:glycerol-3-phosphate 1-O-acyltransferase PlsY [Hyphomonadaceae bacterium]